MEQQSIYDLLNASNRASELVTTSLEYLKEQMSQNPKLAFRILTLGTQYHQEIVNNTREIVSLIKTEEDKTLKNADIQNLVKEIKPCYIQKIIQALQILVTTEFIPKELAVCPECGNFFGKRDCQKYPVVVNNIILGYTYVCNSKKGIQINRDSKSPRNKLKRTKNGKSN